MLLAPNAFEIAGGATTVKLALEVFPVPPWVEATLTLLLLTPAVVAVTLTDSVQFAATDNVVPVKVIVLDPAVAVALPPHVLLSPFGVATTRPEGRKSVK